MRTLCIACLWICAAACGDSGNGDTQDDGTPSGEDSADGSDDDSNASGGGQASGPWADECVVTFTEDYEGLDVFGDVEFSAKKGEKYLVDDFEIFAGGEGATILFLSSAGPVEFDIEVPEGATAPFTSNCSAEAFTTKLGIFQDTTLYEDEELTQELCQLSAGSSELSAGLSYVIAGDDIDLTAPTAVYEVGFGGPLELCDGATGGFIQAESATVHGTDHMVLPLEEFASPSSD